MNESWSYYSDDTIQITGDLSSKYYPNSLIYIIQGGSAKFFLITAVSVVSGNTRITVSGGGLYTLAHDAITAHYYNAEGAAPLLPVRFRPQAEIYSSAEKITLVDDDLLSLLDSAGNYSLKKITWTNLKASLKSYFDSIYSAIGHTHPNTMPESTAEHDVIVSNSLHEWTKKTLSELKAILGLGSAAYTETSAYAISAKGVTNGDSHDHSGGDGAQISYASLSNQPTIPAGGNLGGGSETVGGAASNGSATTFARSDHKHAITNPALDTLAACSDITTRNASTSAHGLLPKLDNIATHFLNGQGNWATPVGASALPFVTVGAYSWCDYVTDGTSDQTEINTALATGKTVVVVGAVYISGTINVTLGNNLEGIPALNRYHKSIIYVTSNINAITVSAGGSVIRDLYINSSASTERNGWAIYATRPVSISGICTNYIKNGFYLSGCNESRIKDCFLLLCTGTNIELNNSSEIYIDDVMMEGWTSQTDSTIGLYIHGGTINVYATACQFMHTGKPFYIDGLMSGRFSQCYFDSYQATAEIVSTANVCRAISFDDCWFAMKTDLTVTYNAVRINGQYARDISFSDCYVRDTPGDAIRIKGSAHHISLKNMHFCEVGYYASASCISIDSTVSHVIVNGCMASEEGTAIAYGVYAEGSYISTTGNDFTLCTAPIVNAGSHAYNQNMT